MSLLDEWKDMTVIYSKSLSEHQRNIKMTTDFLRKTSIKNLKKQLQNICNSYSHPWDILAELSQNSVDAINKWNGRNKGKKRVHEIILEINQIGKSIRITDSGIGFDPNKVAILLAPNETDKDDDETQIGEKGVGLKFAIFSSNKFTLKTKSEFGTYKGEISNSRTWLHNNDLQEDSVPQIEKESTSSNANPAEDTSTEITLEDVDTPKSDMIDIFELSFERLEYLLRTKTAIGYTGKRFKKGDLDIKVHLKLTKEDSSVEERDIPFEYSFPDQFMKTEDILDIDEYEKIAGSLSDNKKRQKLTNKCLKIEGSQELSGRRFYYYCFFVPSTNLWENISLKNKLFCEPTQGSGENISDVSSGIFVSTKCMPTGVVLVPPSTGAAGYWNNFYALVEYDGIKFDIGRKFVHWTIQEHMKTIVKNKFNRMANLKQFVAKSKAPPPKIPQIAIMEKASEINRFIAEIPDLSFSRISFRKSPDHQEAGVVAIFHELIGAGVLKGYFGLKEGYKLNYDFWGKYSINRSNLGKNIRENTQIPEEIDLPLVIEFKHDASAIISDVENDRKHFLEIDLIVCWEINEGEFKKFGIDVQPLREDDAFFYGANYVLDWPSTYDLGQSSKKDVLCLKRFIEDLKREE